MVSCVSFLLHSGIFNICVTAGSDGQEGTPKVTCGWQNAKPPGAGQRLWRTSLEGRGGRRGEWWDCRERAAKSMEEAARRTEGRVYLHQEMKLLLMAKNNWSILCFLLTFWAWSELDAQARECEVQPAWSRRCSSIHQATVLLNRRCTRHDRAAYTPRSRRPSQVRGTSVNQAEMTLGCFCMPKSRWVVHVWPSDDTMSFVMYSAIHVWFPYISVMALIMICGQRNNSDTLPVLKSMQAWWWVECIHLHVGVFFWWLLITITTSIFPPYLCYICRKAWSFPLQFIK